MKKFVLGFIAAIIGITRGTADAQEARPPVYRFTLEDCLYYAKTNNYNLQSLKLSEDVKEDSYKQSKKERLPSLNVSLNENLNNNKENGASWTGNYGLNTNLVLYQGGNISNTIEQNKLKMEQASYQTSQYENNLTIQILQTFLTVLGNEELLKYQQAVLEASEEQWKQGKEQFQFGKILESDYLLLEAQCANDKNNLVDTQISRDNSLLNLKVLLSISPENNLQIIYPDTASLLEMSLLPPLNEVMNRTFLSLPDLKISSYNIDIAKIGFKMSKANYLPTINLQGSIGTGHADDYNRFGAQLSDRLNEQIGISLSIPIYDNSRTKSKVTQSRIALQQAELDKKQTELDVRQTVAAEYQGLVSAYNKYQTTNIKQNAYSKTFDVYRAQFQLGTITAVDLLQQQNNYINALNDYIQSKYEFMLKRKILDVYMGIQVKM
ncbi:MAG: TolC family protein [Dysgonamonadaceae bacterium]|jgi:outer membrane protein|nr:TolC family protein [Dysgonamonadaceae bacterium]